MIKNNCTFSITLAIILLAGITGFLSACSSPPQTEMPTEEAPGVQDTPLPPTEAPTPIPSATPSPTNCLSVDGMNAVLNAYLIDHDAPDLQAVWQTIEKDEGGSGLMSSVTDYNNDFAYGTTWEKLLLLGEFEAQFQLPQASGILHCAVIAFPGGEGPEVGAAISDAVVNGEWTGYAYGRTPSEKATRDFMQKRVGKAVTVRYHVAQNPEDADFIRAGFFSPTMKLLWQDSYYTRIPTDPKILTESVGQPRGPNLREMMIIAQSLGGVGVFLDYITDPIR